MQRLDDKPECLAEFRGPVRLGRFADGTLLIAGPNDEPLLIKHGEIMKPEPTLPNGDITFHYPRLRQAIS